MFLKTTDLRWLSSLSSCGSMSARAAGEMTLSMAALRPQTACWYRDS